MLRTRLPAGFRKSVACLAFISSAKPLSTSTQPAKKRRKRKRISEVAKERAVPTSRIGRAWEFGSLAVGLGIDAARSKLGTSPKDSIGISTDSAERVVDTLCRVRGAALKLGQMISIQDDSTLPPQLAKIFDRVRESADFMPKDQLEAQMTAELGEQWRSKFKEFDDVPFAAASIGQVHRGSLTDGREVAVKVQYPGIADSIDSDIDNLMMILKGTGLLPKGLYIENVLRETRKELKQECDYEREARCCQEYRKRVLGMKNLTTIEVIPELSTSKVLTTGLLEGITLEKVQYLDQETRDLVASTILELTLQELFLWRLVQTDPNWGNFLFDEETKTIQLLDFGAIIEYRKEFIDSYIEIIHAASEDDHDKCLEYSIKAGFLSGYEDEQMHRAHVKSVMALGAPFQSKSKFDFEKQDVTKEVKSQIPIMLKYREVPPPTETYSLHRKLSGSFLICARLRANIECRNMFSNIYSKYQN